MAEHPEYLCKVQLQLQMVRGAQFMALAQIQMTAVRYSIDFIPCLICCQVFSWVVVSVTTWQFIRTIYVFVLIFYILLVIMCDNK